MNARVPRQQRGEQRRDALAAAATVVLNDQGPAAFTARAVAAAAGLPLAAVSYYFPRLDDLLAAATDAVLQSWLAHGEEVAAATIRRGPGAAADAIADALLPPGPPAAVLHRYDHLVAAARSPVTASALAELRPALLALVERILSDTHAASSLSPDALLALVDGAAVGALAEGYPDPRQRVRTVVREALRDNDRPGAQPSQSSNDSPDNLS